MVAQENFCMVAIVTKIMKKFIPKILSHKVSQRCMHELLSFKKVLCMLAVFWLCIFASYLRDEDSLVKQLSCQPITC